VTPGSLDFTSTHVLSACSLFFQSRLDYRPSEGHVEARHHPWPGPPPETMKCLLAEPGGGPWVNCAWVEVLRGSFVGGRIIKTPTPAVMQASFLFPVGNFLFSGHVTFPSKTFFIFCAVYHLNLFSVCAQRVEYTARL
jgi:hypothetical protein